MTLDSFDETKTKCSKCTKYFEIKEAWKIFGAYVCIECGEKIYKQDFDGNYIVPIMFSYVGNPCVPPESLKDKVVYDHGIGVQGTSRQDRHPQLLKIFNKKSKSNIKFPKRKFK